MKENFGACLAKVLVHEGGWSDHPADPGGATMKGITLATFRSFYRNNRLGKDDLRKITDAQIAEIYRKRYWDAVNGDELPAGVDYAVFDFGVNSGPARSAKFLQRVVGVAQDGAIGPQTLAAINRTGAPETIRLLCDARLAWLKTLTTFATFGRGWTTRVNAVKRDAQAMRDLSPPASPPRVPPVSPLPPTSPVQPGHDAGAPETAGDPSRPATGFWAWLLGLLRKWVGN
jgi:lysozyme family protein